MNPYEQKYTLRELDNAMVGLPEGLLQNWIARKVLKLADMDPGRGKKRLFSFAEAIQVHIMSYLTQIGEPSKTAAAIAKIISDFMCEWIKAGKDLDYSYLDDETYPVLLFSKDGVEHIRHKFISKKEITKITGFTYFSIFDFFYSMTGFFDNLESIYSLRKGYGRAHGCNIKGFPKDSGHPWNK